MTLKYKPDFDEAKKYWEYFWNGEVIDRPLVISTIPKNPDNPFPRPPYMSGIHGDFEETVDLFEKFAENTYFCFEKVPSMPISFGPDQFAYFLKGGKNNVIVHERTAWIDPFVTDWKGLPAIELNKNGEWYTKFLNFYSYAAQRGKDKFLIDMADFHTHLDLLRAIRGSAELCIDMIDCPDEIEKRVLEVRNVFPVTYMDIYRSGKMQDRGTIGWIPFYCAEKFATIQCDFICMIGKDMFRKFALPEIEKEAKFLDHCIFHLDGPGALQHLDDLLLIKKIDSIQWVAGSGAKPHIGWLDVLKKILNAGKSLIIYPESKEEIKTFHKELGAKGVVYDFNFGSIEEAEETVKWLKKHT